MLDWSQFRNYKEVRMIGQVTSIPDDRIINTDSGVRMISFTVSTPGWFNDAGERKLYASRSVVKVVVDREEEVPEMHGRWMYILGQMKTKRMPDKTFFTYVQAKSSDIICLNDLVKKDLTDLKYENK